MSYGSGSPGPRKRGPGYYEDGTRKPYRKGYRRRKRTYLPPAFIDHVYGRRRNA